MLPTATGIGKLSLFSCKSLKYFSPSGIQSSIASLKSIELCNICPLRIWFLIPDMVAAGFPAGGVEKWASQIISGNRNIEHFQ